MSDAGSAKMAEPNPIVSAGAVSLGSRTERQPSWKRKPMYCRAKHLDFTDLAVPAGQEHGAQQDPRAIGNQRSCV